MYKYTLHYYQYSIHNNEGSVDVYYATLTLFASKLASVRTKTRKPPSTPGGWPILLATRPAGMRGG